MRFILSLLLLCSTMQLMAAPAKGRAKAKAKTTAKGKKTAVKSKAVRSILIADRGEAGGTNGGHIAIDLDAPRTVQFAAKELQNYLRLITTARYPIQHNADPAIWKPTIFVLGTKDSPIMKPYLEKGAAARDVKKLKDDGYAVFKRSNKILIVGNNPRGVLNGVHRFIYKHTDFIWVRPYKELAIYTESPTLKLEVKDYVDNPKFRLRGWGANGRLAQRCEEYFMYVSRLGNNWAPGGSDSSILGRELDHGFVMEFGGGHNMSTRWLPGKKYGSTNPEYYMLKNGKRVVKYPTQLCYSNQKMTDTFIKETLAIVKTLPDYYSSINIMIDDTPAFCECPNCEKPIKLADGKVITKNTEGYKSTLFFMFLNQVARAVAKERPGLDIKCFGYFFTAVPPAIPVEKNIRISFCPYVRNDKQTLFGPTNEKWLKRTNRYAEMSPSLMWREYYYCGRKSFRAMGNVIATDLRHINKRGIRMIYSELSNGGDRPGYPEGGKGGFTEHDFYNMAGPEFWTINMLFWDPEQDPDELRNEYIKRTYREAAPAMMKFYKYLRDSWVNDPTPAAFNDDYRNDMGDYVVSKGLTEPCRAALAEAAAAVKDPRSKKQLELLTATFESWFKQAAAAPKAKAEVPKADIRQFPGFDFDSGVWAKANKIEPMTRMGNANEMHKIPTDVKVIHNGETLYVGFRCPYIGKLEANKVSRKDKWPSGDHVEIFLSNEVDGYYHLAFNCYADGENGIYDAMGTNAKWSCKWEAKTRIKDGEWRGVAIIPLKSVNIKVEQNNKVKALFYRARPKRVDIPKDYTEHSAWSGGQVHSASSFGQLTFLHE